MKSLGSILSTTQHVTGDTQNIRLVFMYLGFLVALITLYSVLFHFVMGLEGRSHSWLTGFYWTLTVMSTLGFAGQDDPRR